MPRFSPPRLRPFGQWFSDLCTWAETRVDPFVRLDNTLAPAGFWAFMRHHMAPYRRVLAVAAACGVVVALLETWMIYYAGRLVDLMTAAGPEAFLSKHGLELALTALAVLLLRPLAVAGSLGVLNQGFSTNISDQVRWRAHRHLLSQSVGYFQSDFAGRLANRVMQTGTAVEDSIYMAVEAMLYAVAYVLGAVLVLSAADPILMLPLLIWLAAYVGLLWLLIPRIGKASERMSQSRSMLTGRIVDAYTNIQTVKLFAHAEAEEAYAGTALRIHRLRFARLLRLVTILSVSLALINGLLIVVTVGLAIWLWGLGVATAGSAAVAAALTLRLNAMTGWIMWVTSQLFQYAGEIREGLETIAKPHTVVDAADAAALQTVSGAIRFEGVSHAYGREAAAPSAAGAMRADGRPAGGVHDIDLVIAPGERIGLVGRSGAGKSTLVNLLLRFHDPEKGRIRLDGADVRRVTQDSLRRNISVVTQDPALLHRSVRDNIAYGRPEASEAEIRRAAELVHADAFIDALEDPSGRRGLDAHVGERGVKLSGGQRQRVALARAVLKDAPILVLDEATSALDSETELLIQTAMAELMTGKTVIAIAHRLSTLDAMDRIVVLEEGRIAEIGTHEGLLASGGLYAGFWRRQSGGFLQPPAAE